MGRRLPTRGDAPRCASIRTGKTVDGRQIDREHLDAPPFEQLHQVGIATYANPAPRRGCCGPPGCLKASWPCSPDVRPVKGSRRSAPGDGARLHDGRNRPVLDFLRIVGNAIPPGFVAAQARMLRRLYNPAAGAPARRPVRLFREHGRRQQPPDGPSPRTWARSSDAVAHSMIQSPTRPSRSGSVTPARAAASISPAAASNFRAA